MTSPSKPGTFEIVHQVVGFAAAGQPPTLFAVRDDGACFMLVKRGTITGQGVVDEPYWADVAAVPGTVAALEQER